MFQKAIQIEVDKMKKKNKRKENKTEPQGTQIITEKKRTQQKDKVFVFNVFVQFHIYTHVRTLKAFTSIRLRALRNSKDISKKKKIAKQRR